MTVTLVGSSVFDRGTSFAFAVRISTSIEQILEHRNDIAVAYQRPVKRSQRPAIGRPWEVDAFLAQGEQNLPGAPLRPEAGKDQADYLLQAQVGVAA